MKLHTISQKISKLNCLAYYVFFFSKNKCTPQILLNLYVTLPHLQTYIRSDASINYSGYETMSMKLRRCSPTFLFLVLIHELSDIQHNNNNVLTFLNAGVNCVIIIGVAHSKIICIDYFSQTMTLHSFWPFLLWWMVMSSFGFHGESLWESIQSRHHQTGRFLFQFVAFWLVSFRKK